MTAALLLLSLVQANPAPPAPASAILDEGVLVVRRDSVEIAREQYQLVASPRTGGWTLGATSRYAGSTVSGLTLAPVLELGPASLPRTLQFEVTGAAEPLRLLGQASRDRFTLRYLGRGTERAREFPARGPTVVLDDSVYSFYIVAAWFARPSPVRLTAVFARSARLATLTVQDRGLQSTTVHRNAAMLRDITVSDGVATIHVWLDASGKLMKIENPALHWTAERPAT